jgi:hypothetical protein
MPQENDIVCGDMMPKGGMAKLTVFAFSYYVQSNYYNINVQYYSRILAIRMYDSTGTEYCQSMGTTDNYPCPEGAQSCGVQSFDFIPQSGERILSFSAVKFDTSQSQCLYNINPQKGGGWNSWSDYIALSTSSGRKASLRKISVFQSWMFHSSMRH